MLFRSAFHLWWASRAAADFSPATPFPTLFPSTFNPQLENGRLDMAAMSKGEVWIYRPVPLEEYVGTAISADWPPACQAWEVGQLK